MGSISVALSVSKYCLWGTGTGFDVSGPGSYAEALLVLAAIVGIHEAGHFAAARLQGIHVTKFAIGFGPPLLKYQARSSAQRVSRGLAWWSLLTICAK